jgi:protein-tyrosine phosphatase
VQLLCLQLRDEECSALAPHLEESILFLERARLDGARCLVHCVSGKSRSVAIVLAYLLLSKRMNLRDAFRVVRKVRPLMRPNSGRSLCWLFRLVCGFAYFPLPSSLLCFLLLVSRLLPLFFFVQ